MIGGGIECYPLRDMTLDPSWKGLRATRWRYLSAHRMWDPLSCLGNRGGFVYAMEMQGVPSLLFRLKTDGIVVVESLPPKEIDSSSDQRADKSMASVRLARVKCFGVSHW